MGKDKCVVPSCESDKRKEEDAELSFHRFPNPLRKLKLYEQWRTLLHLPHHIASKKHTRVCSKHFLQSDFDREKENAFGFGRRLRVLKKDVVPSQNLPDSDDEVYESSPKRSRLEDEDEEEVDPAENLCVVIKEEDGSDDEGQLIIDESNDSIPQEVDPSEILPSEELQVSDSESSRLPSTEASQESTLSSATSEKGGSTSHNPTIEESDDSLESLIRSVTNSTDHADLSPPQPAATEAPNLYQLLVEDLSKDKKPESDDKTSHCKCCSFYHDQVEKLMEVNAVLCDEYDRIVKQRNKAKGELLWCLKALKQKKKYNKYCQTD